MHRKNITVELKLHPVLTDLLFVADEMYIDRKQELVITSGSELHARHKRTSLHYAGCAVDIRTKNSQEHPIKQGVYLAALVKKYCKTNGIPVDWIEVVTEHNHLHLEYQPKRPS